MKLISLTFDKLFLDYIMQFGATDLFTKIHTNKINNLGIAINHNEIANISGIKINNKIRDKSIYYYLLVHF